MDQRHPLELRHSPVCVSVYLDGGFVCSGLMGGGGGGGGKGLAVGSFFL